MENFKPTYLYVKQHSVTEMMYFGKTVRDPEKYLGSGTLWKRHIKKHGREYVINKWFKLFTNKDDLVEFALFVSEELNIVKSEKWANLMLEDGLNNGQGYKHTQKAKDEISLKMTNRVVSKEACKNVSVSKLGEKNYNYGKCGVLHFNYGQPGPMLGKTQSEETKLKMRKPKSKKHIANLMGPKKTGECPHCHIICAQFALTRWHFDKCKLKVNNV